MFRLAWITDPHFNFLDRSGPKKFGKKVLAETCCDAVVITGDISDAKGLVESIQGFSEGLGRKIYFTLGNHDYYGSSFAEIKNIVGELDGQGDLIWLDAAGVVKLSADTAIVGHEGWYDAVFGDAMHTGVYLSDFKLIKELRNVSFHRQMLINYLKEYSLKAAESVKPNLQKALSEFQNVYFATHVPPFKEACWHEGEISNEDWLPWFSTSAMGEMILEASTAYPKRKITILCGHTHSDGYVKIKPNLEVYTGKAEYGHPRVERIIEL